MTGDPGPHRHWCMHCRRFGLLPGHPYAKEMDAYRHECPACLKFWFSNDDCSAGAPRGAKFLRVTNAGQYVLTGLPAAPLWARPAAEIARRV